MRSNSEACVVSRTAPKKTVLVDSSRYISLAANAPRNTRTDSIHEVLSKTPNNVSSSGTLEPTGESGLYREQFQKKQCRWTVLNTSKKTGCCHQFSLLELTISLKYVFLVRNDAMESNLSIRQKRKCSKVPSTSHQGQYRPG